MNVLRRGRGLQYLVIQWQRVHARCNQPLCTIVPHAFPRTLVTEMTANGRFQHYELAPPTQPRVSFTLEMEPSLNREASGVHINIRDIEVEPAAANQAEDNHDQASLGSLGSTDSANQEMKGKGSDGELHQSSHTAWSEDQVDTAIPSSKYLFAKDKVKSNVVNEADIAQDSTSHPDIYDIEEALSLKSSSTMNDDIHKECDNINDTHTGDYSVNNNVENVSSRHSSNTDLLNHDDRVTNKCDENSELSVEINANCVHEDAKEDKKGTSVPGDVLECKHSTDSSPQNSVKSSPSLESLNHTIDSTTKEPSLFVGEESKANPLAGKTEDDDETDPHRSLTSVRKQSCDKTSETDINHEDTSSQPGSAAVPHMTRKLCVADVTDENIDTISLSALHWDQPADTRKYNLSFAGCGFLGIYHLGAARTLIHHGAGFLSRVEKFGGASAGAIVAAVLAVRGADESALKAGIQFTNETAQSVHKRRMGMLTPRFSVLDPLENFLRTLFPDDAYQKASGRLYLSMTRLKNRRNILVSEYESNEELVKCIIASSYVPMVTGNKPVKFRGRRYIDGGMTENLPDLPGARTIKVSPFSGGQDISPVDKAVGKALKINGQDFHVTKQNIVRSYHAFFPPKLDHLNCYFVQGERDATRFLKKEGWYDKKAPSEELQGEDGSSEGGKSGHSEHQPNGDH